MTRSNAVEDAAADGFTTRFWVHSMASARPGGTIVVCGAATGSLPVTDLRRLYRDQVTLTGSYLGTRAEMTNLIDLVVSAHIQPEIGQSVPMENAADAFADLWHGRTAGKIVLTR